MRLPAVSGSSGRLVIYGPRPRAEGAERTWPGQVFEDPEYTYAAAMHEFVRQSAPARAARRRQEPAEQAARRALRERQRRRAADRGQALQRRQQEDAAWEAACRERRAWLRPDRWAPAHQAAYPAAEDRWLALRAQRRAALARRQEEDARWLADQDQRRAPPAARPPWVAILVVTDSCTRRCLGLPLFVAGPKVTAEEVVAALRALLPAELQFLISDRGTHFTAQPFAAFAREEDFVHPGIAPGRMGSPSASCAPSRNGSPTRPGPAPASGSRCWGSSGRGTTTAPTKGWASRASPPTSSPHGSGSCRTGGGGVQDALVPCTTSAAFNHPCILMQVSARSPRTTRRRQSANCIG